MNKNYSFSFFKTENIQHVLSWIKDEEDRVLWSGNSFRHGLNRITFERHLERKGLFAYQLTDSKNRIIAYGEVVIKSVECATLCRIIVKPTLRSQGLGKLLCKSLLERINQWDSVQKISLNTLTCNNAALSCYQSLGFQIQGIRKRSRRIGRSWHDLVVMSVFTSIHCNY